MRAYAGTALGDGIGDDLSDSQPRLDIAGPGHQGPVADARWLRLVRPRHLPRGRQLPVFIEPVRRWPILTVIAEAHQRRRGHPRLRDEPRDGRRTLDRSRAPLRQPQVGVRRLVHLGRRQAPRFTAPAILARSATSAGGLRGVFDAGMPDFNLRNPKVVTSRARQPALLAESGVDGFPSTVAGRAVRE